MADPRGFLDHRPGAAAPPAGRPAPPRLARGLRGAQRDHAAKQAGRCMDCGIPFCHQGCPLGNMIPEWNDLVWRDDWSEAIERLHATNNFPEFTGTLCPAPCEAACVLGHQLRPGDDQAGRDRDHRPRLGGGLGPSRSRPRRRPGKSVAVVGSGPAGLAAAQQLTRAGHDVTVFERADRIGGLLRYGIPEFKMEKKRLDRRLEQMAAEGTHFVAGVEVGGRASTTCRSRSCARDFDAVVLAVGATAWRDLPIPGRELAGVHQAMEYLPPSNQVQQGDYARSDHRRRGQARRGHRRRRHRRRLRRAPPTARAPRRSPSSRSCRSRRPSGPNANPWPTYPTIFRVSSAHEEGGERLFSVNTEEFLGDEHGTPARAAAGRRASASTGASSPSRTASGRFEADLVFLAMGFLGPQKEGLLDALGVEYDERGNVRRGDDYETLGARRVRRRRRGPRPVAHRVGDRRGPLRRGGRRRHAHRPRRPAAPDQPGGPRARLSPSSPPPGSQRWVTCRVGAHGCPGSRPGPLGDSSGVERALMALPGALGVHSATRQASSGRPWLFREPSGSTRRLVTCRVGAHGSSGSPRVHSATRQRAEWAPMAVPGAVRVHSATGVHERRAPACGPRNRADR